MTFWELFGTIVSSAGLFASILGAFLIYAARKNGDATRALIRTMEERMSGLLREMRQQADEGRQEFRALLEKMDDRLEKMDGRDDARHRNIVDAITTLKGK